MNLFIKLKHWQLFVVWIVALVQMVIFIKSDFWILSFGFYVFSLLGWYYSIGKFLNKDYPEQIHKLKWWTLICFVSFIPIGLYIHDFYVDLYEHPNPMVFFVFGLINFIFLMKIILLSVKSFSTENSQNEFEKHKLLLFLFLYPYIGVWWIQPQLNKRYNTNN